MAPYRTSYSSTCLTLFVLIVSYHLSNANVIHSTQGLAVAAGQTVPCSGSACNATSSTTTMSSSTSITTVPSDSTQMTESESTSTDNPVDSTSPSATQSTKKEPNTVPCSGSACNVTQSSTFGPYDYICRGQPDGDYPVPDVVCPDYFITCYQEIGYPKECPVIEILLQAATGIRKPKEGTYDYICRGQPNGYYAAPDVVCPKFYIACYEELAYARECSANDAALQHRIKYI